MHKIGIFPALIVLSLLPTISFGQEKAEQPSYKDGDFWHFSIERKNFQTYSSARSDGDYEVRFMNGEPRVYALGGGEKKGEVTGQSADGLKRRLANKDEREDLLFPLFVGKKWKTAYQEVGKVTQRHTVETEVTGFEEVTTPAGVFKAFKLQRVDDNGRNNASYSTYFYSPETRSIIKSTSETKATRTSGRGASQADGQITEIVLIKLGSE
jgi:hypothetical protein